MLNLAIILVDFALVVLIWLVQTIIYPSFQYVADDVFASWHATYSRLITVFVGPLMIVQVAAHGIGLYREPTLGKGLAVLSIVLVWGCTFALSVPCHNTLAEQGKDQGQVARLVQTNWWRTIAWSGVFLLSLLNYGRPLVRLGSP